MDRLVHDLRYCLRTLIQARGFTMIAVLTLALGIGANTAMFSVVNTVLLRPLPFHEPDRLMSLATINKRQGEAVSSISYPDFFDYRAQNHSFEDIASYHGANYALTGFGDAVLLRGQMVASGFFNILGVQPSHGRGFLPEEEKPGHHVVVISDALWRSRFHSDPNVIGKTINLSGRPYNIIGVAPSGFQFPIQSDATDIWLSMSREAEVDAPGEQPSTAQRGAHYLDAIGRLKPGVTREQAEADLSTIAAALANTYPDSNTNEEGVRVRSVLNDLTGDTRRPLLILLAAVGCVLLIACANVANLVLARSSGRSREIAVRAALGATRGRIVQQLITECLVLSIVGAIAGMLLARWAIAGLVHLYPQNLPRAEQVGIDPYVLVFTGGLAILTGILFGLAPALQASRTNLNEAMREGGRGTAGAKRHTRLRSGLVVAETAIGVMLLIGAGLLIRSMNRLAKVDLGFEPEHVLSANFDISQTRYNGDQQDRFYTELLTRVRALPGVTAASAAVPLPLSPDNWSISFDILEHPLPKGQQPSAAFYDVSPGFIEALKIPLLQGRTFNDHDTRDGNPVMVVNQAWVQRYMPGQNPIGKLVEVGAGEGPKRKRWKTREIIGVVGNIRNSQIGRRPVAAFFVPMPQLILGPPTLIVRTSGDPNTVVADLRNTLASMDPDAPLYDVKTLADYFALALGRARFQTILLSLFAGVALLLTAIGLYGVIAYGVVQRTHEIGVRMALGASRIDIMRMVLNRGLVLTLVGVGVGVLGALALARLIQSLLYEIPPRDPATYIVVCFTLSAVALLASYIPALRATRVDPIIALRYE